MLSKLIYNGTLHNYILGFIYCSTILFMFNPPTFGTFFIQVDVPFETIRYCGFEW